MSIRRPHTRRDSQLEGKARDGSGARLLRGVRRAWMVALAGISMTACTGLRPLPPASRVPLPTTEPPGAGPQAPRLTTDQLWQQVEVGLQVPARSESAYRSTMRMVFGDLGNKKRGQRQATACWEAPPPGFEVIPGARVDASGAGLDGVEIAPLFAYLHRGRADLPVVFVIHGLYDSRNSLYVRRTAEALAARGFGVVVPDMRWHGCLLGEEWLPGMGTLEAKDLVAWSTHVRSELAASAGRDRPAALVGFSLGGLAVLHAMAEPPAAEAFRAGGVALSPPAALDRILPRLDEPSYFADRGLLTLIDRGFRKFLEQRVEDQGIPQPPELTDRPFEAVLRYMAARMLPPTMTALMPGNSGVGDVLLRFADPAPHVAAARAPLLVLTTSDDPLFGSLAADELEGAAADQPLAHVIRTSHGGHIGQLGLYPDWTLEVLLRFLTLAPGVDAGSV